MKKITLILLSTLAIVGFTGCGEDEERTVVQENVQPYYDQPQYAPAPQTVVVRDSHSGAGDMMTGMVAGALIGNALSNSGGTTVNKTVINRSYTSTPSTSTTGVSTTAVNTSKLNHTTPSPKTVQKAPEKPAKASYRSEAAKKPQTAGAKASYRQKSANTGYKPTDKKSTYRSKPKTKSSWGSFKKSSFRRKK